jgi:hypothetical protein
VFEDAFARYLGGLIRHTDTTQETSGIAPDFEPQHVADESARKRLG